MTARVCALKVLFEVEKNQAYSDKALKKELAAAKMPREENSFATELVNGVLKNKTRLDYIIQKNSRQKLKKLSIWILNILRLGIYQIEFLDKIPNSAAVNESVKLAKRYGHSASAGFVNGVLRGFIRNPKIDYPEGKKYYEVFYSCPGFLVELYFSQYGEETAKNIIIANNKTPTTTIRANSLKCTVEGLKESLLQSGITVKNTDFENVLEISKYGDISKLKEFTEGLFTVQDISAYKASLSLNPKEGQLIMDVCAAPGGKTTHLAELSNDKAKIIAFDIHPHKISIIEKNAKRLGIKSISTKEFDATNVFEDYIGKADGVLADVPCSGLGIIRKKPDIKWSKSLEEIDEIIKIQKQILISSSKYVKAGGTLVYSTCTLNKSENEGVTHEFALDNPFEITEENTILPGTDNGDGFYICKLKRI